jgi:hypothetical protein
MVARRRMDRQRDETAPAVFENACACIEYTSCHPTCVINFVELFIEDTASTEELRCWPNTLRRSG